MQAETCPHLQMLRSLLLFVFSRIQLRTTTEGTMVKALVYLVNAEKSCIQQAYTTTVYATRDGRFAFFLNLRYGPYFPKDCSFFKKI